jgi:hypothetical protein
MVSLGAPRLIRIEGHRDDRPAAGITGDMSTELLNAHESHPDTAKPPPTLSDDARESQGAARADRVRGGHERCSIEAGDSRYAAQATPPPERPADFARRLVR